MLISVVSAKAKLKERCDITSIYAHVSLWTNLNAIQTPHYKQTDATTRAMFIRKRVSLRQEDPKYLPLIPGAQTEFYLLKRAN